MKPEEIEFQKTSFDLPVDLLTRFRIACARRKNIPMKLAVAEAIEAWIDSAYPQAGASEAGIRSETGTARSESGTKPPTVSTTLRFGDNISESDPPLSDREREWLAQALRILRSATQLAKSLQENLIGFSLGVEAMEELERLKAALNEPKGSSVPPAGQSIASLQKRTEAARRNQAAIGRGMAGTAEPRKRVPKTKT